VAMLNNLLKYNHSSIVNSEKPQYSQKKMPSLAQQNKSNNKKESDEKILREGGREREREGNFCGKVGNEGVLLMLLRKRGD